MKLSSAATAGVFSAVKEIEAYVKNWRTVSNWEIADMTSPVLASIPPTM